MAEIALNAEEMIQEFRRMYPREFEIAALTLTNRKLREQVVMLEELTAVPEDSTFWKGSEKPVPLRAEKE